MAVSACQLARSWHGQRFYSPDACVSAAPSTVNRLGFGAMRIVGRGIWGPPEDRAEALRTLRRLPAILASTSSTPPNSYGPDFSEALIREALHPYGGIHVATKGGLARTGPNIWIPLGRPEYLIQQAHKSRWRLGVETIDLWQLHRIDPKSAGERTVRRHHAR